MRKKRALIFAVAAFSVVMLCGCHSNKKSSMSTDNPTLETESSSEEQTMDDTTADLLLEETSSTEEGTTEETSVIDETTTGEAETTEISATEAETTAPVTDARVDFFAEGREYGTIPMFSYGNFDGCFFQNATEGIYFSNVELADARAYLIDIRDGGKYGDVKYSDNNELISLSFANDAGESFYFTYQAAQKSFAIYYDQAK